MISWKIIHNYIMINWLIFEFIKLILFSCQANVYFIMYIYIYEITFDVMFFFINSIMKLWNYEIVKKSKIKNYAFK